MAIPSRASVPPGRTCANAAASLPSWSAAAKERCSSRSVGMACLDQLLDPRALGEQRIEAWQPCIPLNKRAHRPETLKRRAVQPPYRRAHRLRMRVDEDRALARTLHAVAGEMDLLNGPARDVLQVEVRIKAMVDGVDVEVIDIEKDGAAGLDREGDEKFPFGKR